MWFSNQKTNSNLLLNSLNQCERFLCIFMAKNTHSCLLPHFWPQGSESSQLSAASFLCVLEIEEHCSITSCAFKHHLSFYYLQIASVPLQGHSRPRRVLGIPPTGLLLLNCLNGSIHLRMFVCFFLFTSFILFFSPCLFIKRQSSYISIKIHRAHIWEFRCRYCRR